MYTRKRRSKIWNSCGDNQFRNMILSSKSYGEALAYFGLVNKGSNYRTIQSRIVALGISTSHFKSNIEQLIDIRSRTTRTLESILVDNSVYNRRELKRRLVSNNLLTNNCYECGLGDMWNGKSISLQLDHINGISTDNRLINLRLLCPNCHSQTHTFAGRNKNNIKPHNYCSCGKQIYNTSTMCRTCANMSRVGKRRVVNRPSCDVLISEIQQYGYVKTSNIYSVSDNCIRKWVRGYGFDPKTLIKK